MVIAVSGRDLVESLNALGSGKKVVNFSIVGTFLSIQSFEPVIYNESIPIAKVFELDKTNNISAEIDTSYNIIEDSDMVLVDIGEQSLVFKTESFYSRYSKSFTQKLDVEKMDTAKTYTSVECFSIGLLAKAEQAVNAVARALKVNEPAVIIKNGYAYIILSNMAYRVKTEWPDCVLSIRVVRALNAILSRYKIQSVNLEVSSYDSSYFIIDLGRHSYVAFTFKTDSSMLSVTIDNLINECSPYKRVNFNTISSGTKIALSTFKNIEAVLCISDNGARLSINKGTANQINIGTEPSNDKVLLRTSIIIVSAITRIFGSDLIDVRKGGRYLCCMKGDIALLMSGVI